MTALVAVVALVAAAWLAVTLRWAWIALAHRPDEHETHYDRRGG